MTKEVDYSVGRFAVVSGHGYDTQPRLRPQVFRIDAETPKTIKQQRGTRHDVKQKTEVMATFADEQSAKHLVQAIDGIRGEQDRRINAARMWATKAADDKLSAITQVSA